MLWRLLVPVFWKKVERNVDSAELLRAQVVAQRFTHPCRHGAQDRMFVINSYFREHDPYHRVVLVPTPDVGLPSPRRERTQNPVEEFSPVSQGKLRSGVQEHQ